MQIVIDIPEETYNEVCWRGLSLCPRGEKELVKAIKNGTPLPKEHGDLVDFDKLCREYWDGNYMEIHRNDLQSIKPIIEADTERSDEE